MIIELTWYEPHGGRKYESPLGGEIEAAEHYRVDCVECWYTKLKITDLEDETLAQWVLDRFGISPDLLPMQASTDLQWYEAIYVRYRCPGDTDYQALMGIGYTLQLYGAEQRPNRLSAKLGPPREEVENDVE